MSEPSAAVAQRAVPMLSHEDEPSPLGRLYVAAGPSGDRWMLMQPAGP
jgi:hypothetical protein